NTDSALYEMSTRPGLPFRFGALAPETNTSMTRYVVDRVGKLLNEHRKPLNGSEVLLLGVTYKAGIADQRESPAMPVAEALRERKSTRLNSSHVSSSYAVLCLK